MAKAKEVTEIKSEKVSKAKPELTKLEKLTNLRTQVNGYFKQDVLKFAEDYSGDFILRRPTGILSLDIAIQGGFPARGICEIAGRNNVGKNALCFTTCKRNQEIYGNESCIGLALVEPLDKGFAKNLGFHIAFSDEEIATRERARREMGDLEFKYTEEQRAYLKQQIGHVMHVQCMTAEDMLYTALKMVESNEFQIVMIDSIGALVTEDQDEKEIGEKTFGGNSMVIQSFVNKFIKISTDTTVLAINQIREIIGATQYQKKERVLGGNALKHGKLLSIWLTPGERIKVPIKGVDTEVGRVINWVIEKQKAGGPDGDIGKYNFYKGKHGYPLGVDVIGDLIVSAVMYDVVEQEGRGFIYESEKHSSKEVFSNWLKTRPEIVGEIRNKIFRKANISFITKR